MILKIESPEQKNKYLSHIRQIAMTESLCATKYLDFGDQVIRVLCYSSKILFFLEQQVPFILRDRVSHYDKTIVFWEVKNVSQVAQGLDERLDLKRNLRMRVEILLNQRVYPNIEVMEDKFSLSLPVISIKESNGTIEAYDTDNKVCYYAVRDMEPEEFIKLGHLFVQQLNVLLKTKKVNLTHGAVFGYHGQGVLLCARGQRGKSTLTVHSLLNGCEYVSDDYQLLEHNQDGVYSYPIYSIITLSPQMYHQMYRTFEGKFCCNNARKDKYVFDISHYHTQFKTRYPIKMCLFPEIVPDETPSIIACSAFEKGRAIVQLIHSTVLQMRDLNDHDTIAKLFQMIKDLPFYKFNLSPHIAKNTEYLQQFLAQALPSVLEQKNLNRLLLDITFDLANILDTETNTFYSLNKFATNIYECLLSGVSPNQIAEELKPFVPQNTHLIEEFNLFINKLKEFDLLSVQMNDSKEKRLNLDFIKECEYKLSIFRFELDSTNELIQLKKGE